MKKKIKHVVPSLLTALYFITIHWSMGLRIEHILLSGFVLVCYYLHPRTRRFALDFLPFVLFGILYDFLRIFPKNWAGPIHVAWPYEMEKLLFGFHYEGQVITWNEFFRTHTSIPLDLITGVTYSLHMVIPLGFAFLSWLKHPIESRRFIQAFLLVNFFAFVTYIAFPAAPPWYIEQYGFVPANWSLVGSPGGLANFDHFFGANYFHDIYAKGSWVFGAIPSMHAGFPLLVILFAHRFLKKGMTPLYLYMFLIWFSAVYLRHHYVIDLIAGVLYVFVAYFLVRLLTKSKQGVPDENLSL